MTRKFEDGDGVRVKSGGPTMTIAFYDDTMQQYTCQWFDGKNQKNGDFNEAVLEKATPVRPAIAGPRRISRS